MRLSGRTVGRIDSPIGTTYSLLERRGGHRRLLDLAQAAPQYPPAPEVVEHVVAVARDVHGAEYTEIAGLPHLREAFAAELSRAYAGDVRPEHVVVTAGCNQAFCLAISALAGPGDEVVLALPFYFNHDMWLQMSGIAAVHLEPGACFVPDPERAAALITPRTRAIVLVTPGNPSGVTVDPATIERFALLARGHDIALVLDETYRSFRGTDEPAHRLFADQDWARTVVSLHSFSKDLAIPGFRVGAVVAGTALNREVCKLLDCVAICAPRVGQEAAWRGLAATEWRSARAAEIGERQRLFAAALAPRPGGFELLSAGGWFGWVRHPFRGRPTEQVVAELVHRFDTLVVPGTAFQPTDTGAVRISVSNATPAAITDLAERLEAAGRAMVDG